MTETAPPPDPAAAMPPGRYIRLRREAAGLTIQHIAIVLVPAGRPNAGADRAEYRRRLALLEADQLAGPLQVALVDLLRPVFPFDAGIYWLLVGRAADPESEIPIPGICRGCGCTWNDACIDGDQGCAWVDIAQTLCSVCAREGRAAAPAAGEVDHAA